MKEFVPVSENAAAIRDVSTIGLGPWFQVAPKIWEVIELQVFNNVKEPILNLMQNENLEHN